MDKATMDKCVTYSKHFTGLMNIECAIVDISEEPTLSTLDLPERFCTHCCYEKRDELATHIYGCNEAYRWNGKYIYYCPIGMVFVASCITDKKGSLTGALLQGPFVMGPLEDILVDFPYPSMVESVKKLPVLTPDQVRNLSEIMACVTARINGSAHNAGGFGPGGVEQQQILNTLYDVMEKYSEPDEVPRYPIESEKRLQQLVKSGDREGSMELLNQLLGDIYFISGFDLNQIKSRVLELLVGISRAAIEAGADAREIFRFNEDNIRAIDCIEDIEKLSVWLNRLLLRFVSSSFELVDVKHADIIHKVVHYIRQNFQQKISLEDISEHVGLSKSYLSTVFKEEMNTTLTAYIQSIRVEKSKALLLNGDIALADVAALCGFDDQSYFTKIFKRETGTSPKKYRQSQGEA